MVNTKRRGRRNRPTLPILGFISALFFGAGVLLGLAVLTRDPAAVKTAITIILLVGLELVRQEDDGRRGRRR